MTVLVAQTRMSDCFLTGIRKEKGGILYGIAIKAGFVELITLIYRDSHTNSMYGVGVRFENITIYQDISKRNKISSFHHFPQVSCLFLWHVWWL